MTPGDEDPIPPTIAWHEGRVRMIDQRLLPGELVMLDASTVDELCAAIRDLAVRGAPALGVAALLAASQTAYDALRLVGAAYLVWLGAQSLLAARRSITFTLLAL